MGSIISSFSAFGFFAHTASKRVANAYSIHHYHYPTIVKSPNDGYLAANLRVYLGPGVALDPDNTIVSAVADAFAETGGPVELEALYISAMPGDSITNTASTTDSWTTPTTPAKHKTYVAISLISTPATESTPTASAVTGVRVNATSDFFVRSYHQLQRVKTPGGTQVPKKLRPEQELGEAAARDLGGSGRYSSLLDALNYAGAVNAGIGDAGQLDFRRQTMLDMDVQNHAGELNDCFGRMQRPVETRRDGPPPSFRVGARRRDIYKPGDCEWMRPQKRQSYCGPQYSIINVASEVEIRLAYHTQWSPTGVVRVATGDVRDAALFGVLRYSPIQVALTKGKFTAPRFRVGTIALSLGAMIAVLFGLLIAGRTRLIRVIDFPTLTLQAADGTLYNVYRHNLISQSEVFNGMLTLPIPNHPTLSLSDSTRALLEKAKDAGLEGTSDATVVAIPAQFTAMECDKFLELFSIHEGDWTPAIPSLDDLCAILKTSHFFVVQTGIDYATHHLDQHEKLGPARRFRMGCDYHIPSWVTRAFDELVTIPIMDVSTEDQERLGWETLWAVARAQAAITDHRVTLAVCPPEPIHESQCYNIYHCTSEWEKAWTSQTGILGKLLKEELPGREIHDDLDDGPGRKSILKKEEDIIDDAIAGLVKQLGLSLT
ncbi:hypothetical protein B0H14DRAFT_3488196 [Mycena olivaceomarginata]|nr:hypothetical protein B0H14DRAFT_3488196 [Mycena olivaceomarginata]